MSFVMSLHPNEPQALKHVEFLNRSTWTIWAGPTEDHDDYKTYVGISWVRPHSALSNSEHLIHLCSLEDRPNSKQHEIAWVFQNYLSKDTASVCAQSISKCQVEYPEYGGNILALRWGQTEGAAVYYPDWADKKKQINISRFDRPKAWDHKWLA